MLYHAILHVMKFNNVLLSEFMQDCFGEDPWCYCIVVEKEQPQDGHSSQNTKKHLIGCSIYHHTYKAYLGRGLFLIDLFVIPSERSKCIINQGGVRHLYNADDVGGTCIFELPVL